MRNVDKRNKRNKRKVTSKNAYSQGGSESYTIYHNKYIGYDPRQLMTMCYSDSYTVSQPTVSASNYQYRMNSVFDPDFTGVGHQPYRFDQMAALFTRYRVRSFSWLVQFHSTSMPIYALVVPTNGDLASAIVDATTFNAAVELPYAVRKPQCYSGGPSATFRGKKLLNQVCGVTPTQYNTDDRFQAQVSTNPVELMYLNIAWHNPTAGSVQVYFDVCLEFEVEFCDPPVLSQS